MGLYEILFSVDRRIACSVFSAMLYLAECLRVFTERTPRATPTPTSKPELGSGTLGGAVPSMNCSN